MQVDAVRTHLMHRYGDQEKEYAPMRMFLTGPGGAGKSKMLDVSQRYSSISSREIAATEISSREIDIS